MKYTVSLPLSLKTSRKTTHYLNLNIYRNAHHRTLHAAKRMFAEQMQDRIRELPFFEKVRLTYRLYPRTKRKMDVSNVCSVVDKFFCDALVEEGRIPDDNYDHIPEIKYIFGEVDKTNPRVDVEIEHYEIIDGKPCNEEDQMQITLNQDEIEDAIKAHVLSQININPDQTITVDMKATRGDQGFSAILDIRHTGSGQADAPVKAAPTKVTPVPAEDFVETVTQPVNKPEPVVEEPAPEPEVVEEPQPQPSPFKGFESDEEEPDEVIDDDDDGSDEVEEEPQPTAAKKPSIFNFEKG